MSTSPFLDAVVPLPAPPEARYIWAKVTQSSPLRIQVDGDRTPLGITPDDLGGGPRPVDQRVYCQIMNRRLVVLGPVVIPPAVDLTPSGAVLSFAGASAPAGYLLCDGSAVSRTTYAALYAALGGASSPYGQGNGSTTFNVPNLKGRAVVGRDAAQTEFDTLGETGGAKTHTHTMGTHTHSIPSHSHGPGSFAATAMWTGSWLRYRHRTSAGWTPTGYITNPTSGSSTAVQTTGLDIVGSSDAWEGTTGATDPGDTAAGSSLAPYLTLNYIIKT